MSEWREVFRFLWWRLERHSSTGQTRWTRAHIVEIDSFDLPASMPRHKIGWVPFPDGTETFMVLLFGVGLGFKTRKIGTEKAP